MNREYECPVTTGKPRVAYKEAINKRSEFNYLHKKQTEVQVNLVKSLATLSRSGMMRRLKKILSLKIK